ncbi:hypothetical protein J6590_033558 [Homalodisca vitripennis]|nr:hypothetical protein J6590_033558 [Homalodisca vitripennis]
MRGLHADLATFSVAATPARSPHFRCRYPSAFCDRIETALRVSSFRCAGMKDYTLTSHHFSAAATPAPSDRIEVRTYRVSSFRCAGMSGLHTDLTTLCCRYTSAFSDRIEVRTYRASSLRCAGERITRHLATFSAAATPAPSVTV